MVTSPANEEGSHNFQEIVFTIVGTSPYVPNKFIKEKYDDPIGYAARCGCKQCESRVMKFAGVVDKKVSQFHSIFERSSPMATKAKASTNGSTKNRIAEHLPESKQQNVVIAPPNFQVAEFKIIGESPYVQNKFSQKAKEMMKAKQEAGAQAKKGTKRDPKDFQQCYEDAKYISREGWIGIPAASFRAAMVSACRTVGFKMTHAKLGFTIVADGYEKHDGVPLVKFTKGSPHYFEQAVRNETGVADIRARPMWDEGWEALLKIRFDADMFTASDIANLLHRAGEQVGIGEGRPDSKKCVGLGWGTFSLK